MNGQLIKDAMVLTVITLVAGLALGFVSEITKEPIARAEADALNRAYQSVFSDAFEFEPLEGFDAKAATAVAVDAGYASDDITDCQVAKGSDGSALGYIISVTTHDGYGGDISFSMGVTNEGVMNGYSITSIGETPGLGMKATEEKFYSQFEGIPVGTYEVTKSSPAGENEIEAISGATITSRSVTNGVNAAMAYFGTLEGGGDSE
ncbi:MAG: RnfABCDGE type electron transport complex subunit G [Lachnospiraceae bacterium]|nr:RnfABCDGE type electron transport complex subunit G [Lachnospiraceae bacterium]